MATYLLLFLAVAAALCFWDLHTPNQSLFNVGEKQNLTSFAATHSAILRCEKITLYHTVLESLEEMKAENQEIMEAVGRFDDFMGALINAFNLARRVDAFDKESVQHFVGGQPHGQLSRDKAKLLRKKRGRLLREGQDIITVLLETFDKLPNDLQELYGETLGFLKGQSILLSREKSSAGAGRDDNGHYRRDL